MSMDDFWSPDRFRAATQGRWLQRPDAHADSTETERLTGVCIDSRAVEPGVAFIAIRGERFDGHDFVDAAAAAGAALIVIDREACVSQSGSCERVLLVEDTRRALGQLAAAYRKEFGSLRVVAITGSNGKTTTKRLVHAALTTTLRGRMSPKSFNNDIGVPLTLLSARAGDQYLVVEVGTNAPGEIAALGKLIEPDLAVITNIGRSHLAGLGSVEGVAREKLSLLSCLAEGGWAITNADSPGLESLRLEGMNHLRFGASESADIRISSVQADADGVSFTLNGGTAWRVPLVGGHHAWNAAAAIAVARRFGLDDEAIAQGLHAVETDPLRFRTTAFRGATVYNDAYNANPESMLAALRTFQSVTPAGSRRILVLGAMLELGDHAPSTHDEIVDEIARLDTESPFERVVLLGAEFADASARLTRRWSDGRVEWIERLDDAESARIAEMIDPGSFVLLKGSRGVGLERILEAEEASIG
ncbi:MAG: UDP-N-acetylmuramoyl-tripeptide--D-alanyl-D-alanine ligase [Phycisphaerales bacterium]